MSSNPLAASSARNSSLPSLPKRFALRLVLLPNCMAESSMYSNTPILDAVASDLQQNVNYMALLTGYTDATGDELYNIGLAQRRAQAVQLHLAQQLGNDFVRLATIGFGEMQPLGDNTTKEGRALNRRTEVILVRPAPAPAGSSELPPTALRP